MTEAFIPLVISWESSEYFSKSERKEVMKSNFKYMYEKQKIEF